jgi:hypothetical protein
MTTMAAPRTNLLPSTGHAPGELLWGEAPRRQPIAPLVLMAVVLLLVAAPAALAGGGGSANPIRLMRDVADTTWELTGLMQQSNDSLASIDANSKNLLTINENMAGIATATAGMQAKTLELNERLGAVGSSVGEAGKTLSGVDAKLKATAASMSQLKASVGGSAASTKAVVAEFSKIDSAIGSMRTSLDGAIARMAASGPLTKAFAENRTRLAIAGGDSKKYGVPNLAPDSRVMNVALPMIQIMQRGGALPARKDRHEASNPIVGTALKLQVPDGVNVMALVRPFDGFYGLPDEQFFVNYRIHGF